MRTIEAYSTFGAGVQKFRMFTITKIIANKNDRIMRFYLEFGKNSLVFTISNYKFPNVKSYKVYQCTEFSHPALARCGLHLGTGAIDGISKFAYAF
jgi:hypothetical protein